MLSHSNLLPNLSSLLNSLLSNLLLNLKDLLLSQLLRDLLNLLLYRKVELKLLISQSNQMKDSLLPIDLNLNVQNNHKKLLLRNHKPSPRNNLRNSLKSSQKLNLKNSQKSNLKKKAPRMKWKLLKFQMNLFQILMRKPTRDQRIQPYLILKIMIKMETSMLDLLDQPDLKQGQDLKDLSQDHSLEDLNLDLSQQDLLQKPLEKKELALKDQQDLRDLMMVLQLLLVDLPDPSQFLNLLDLELQEDLPDLNLDLPQLKQEKPLQKPHLIES